MSLTAKNVIESWLSACNISTVHEDGADVAFQANGKTFKVKIGNGDDPNFYWVSKEDIVNKKSSHNVKTFKKILDAAGVEDRGRFFRGNEDDLDYRSHKARGHEDEELRMMRHSEWRIAPDLDDWTPYEPLIKKMTSRFYFVNHMTLKMAGIEKEDLEQYVRMWIMCFMHKYRRKSTNENIRMLVGYLKQRCGEFVSVAQTRSLNTAPDLGTLDAHLYSDATLNGDYWYIQSERDNDSEYKCMSQKEAQKKLKNAISQLTPEEAVAKLAEAADNQFLAHDARSLAKRLMKKYGG